MKFRRLIQISLFFLFLFLLWLAAYPLPSRIDVDLFLRLDPLVSLGSMGAARVFIPGLAWALVMLGLTAILGRVFCGYLCPLGSTLVLDKLEATGFESQDWRDALSAYLAGRPADGPFSAAG